VPDAVGEVVEDWTGANPRPAHLVLPPVAPLSALAQLGQQIFNDPSLSESGMQSCASCHSPQHSYGPPNSFPVQLGGAHMTQTGYRPPPSLTYLYRQPPFSIGPDQGESDTPVSLDQAASAARGATRVTKTDLQRFTSVHDQVANLFMHCRYNANAQDKRQARTQAFEAWETVTGNSMPDRLSE